MDNIRIAIIGGGPRGLNVIQAIAAAARGSLAGIPVDVHLIEPGEPGQGSHSSRQMDCLITNTLASQVTASPPKDIADINAGHLGPSFTEWARAEGYRSGPDGYHLGTDGDAVTDDAYLPRSMLGRYLNWCYEGTLRALPSAVRVLHYKNRATDLSRRPGGWLAHLGDAAAIECDFVFLTTGHGLNRASADERRYEEFVARHKEANPELAFFRTIYPCETLGRISPDATVAIEGLGLTACDAIVALTAGRGGRFVTDSGRLRYVRSGREPQILFFSRTGLPYAARGTNQKGIAGRHVARFLTVDAVDRLRDAAMRRRGSRRLDFEREVLPLIKVEMAFAFRSAREGREAEGSPFVATREERLAIERIFDPVGGHRFENLAAFQSFALEHARWDLAEAYKGNLTSPWKAATDAVRDCREAIYASFEHRGLLPESHRYFVEQFVPTMNRISFGPPRHRAAELIALIEAGVVGWAGGPSSRVALDDEARRFQICCTFAKETSRRRADVLVLGRLAPYRPAEDTSELSANLISRGLVRPFCNGAYHPSGIDIDREQHPITQQGQVLKTIWVIGYPAEGARGYTHALPRPYRRGGAMMDGYRAVADLSEQIHLARKAMAS
jgi:uncharacterized NAD(P)/FAD-binding protein YdhS